MPIASGFLALLSLSICLILLIGSRDIAPPMFDPVGSAALPIASALVLLLLGAACLLHDLLRRRFRLAAADRQTSGTRLATVGLLVLMLGYVLAMQLGLRFSIATAGFVTLAIPLICRRLQILPLALILALLLGFGAEWLFTHLFYIDLPGKQ